MLKTLLLVTALGSLAMLPEPAAAGGYGPGQPRTTSSFALRILVLPAPKIIQHHHRPGQLRPQPVFRFGHPPPTWRAPAARHFWHPAPRPGWQRPPRHLERRFQADGPRRHGGQWRHGFERHDASRGWHAARGRHGPGHNPHRR